MKINGRPSIASVSHTIAHRNGVARIWCEGARNYGNVI